MNPDEPALTISAPGRICLFGEHQDYLNLPVIPMAISLRVNVTGRRTPGKRIHIDLPDIASRESFLLDTDLAYRNERDYFRSAVNVLHRTGCRFSTGFHCTVNGRIPINSGTSSSSALLVAWIRFLLGMSDSAVDTNEETIARLAHAAEVMEFSEPGGMMDHFACAYGGTLILEFDPVIHARRLPVAFGAFVLGDSGQPKDTRGILSRVKTGVTEIAAALASADSCFSLNTADRMTIRRFHRLLNQDQIRLLEGTLDNLAITREAVSLLETQPLDHVRFGRLLNAHQDILRDVLAISTEKIDGMIDAALNAGAPGAKINGSGGGGCMFAYAPDNPEAVALAIEKAGGKAMIVHTAPGVQEEPGPGTPAAGR